MACKSIAIELKVKRIIACNMRPSLKYLLSGVSIWVLVDYTTAFMPDTDRWTQHMPDIWLFYV